MVKDNLTDALKRWEDGGVTKKDLSAPTLYRDLLNGWINSDSMIDTSTNFIQMIQGRIFDSSQIWCI